MPEIIVELSWLLLIGACKLHCAYVSNYNSQVTWFGEGQWWECGLAVFWGQISTGRGCWDDIHAGTPADDQEIFHCHRESSWSLIEGGTWGEHEGGCRWGEGEYYEKWVQEAMRRNRVLHCSWDTVSSPDSLQISEDKEKRFTYLESLEIETTSPWMPYPMHSTGYSAVSNFIVCVGTSNVAVCMVVCTTATATANISIMSRVLYSTGRVIHYYFNNRAVWKMQLLQFCTRYTYTRKCVDTIMQWVFQHWYLFV